MKNKYILLIAILAIKSFAGVDILTQGNIKVTLDDLDGFAYKIPQDKRDGFFDSPERLEKTLYTILNMKHIISYGKQKKYINPEKFQININNKLAEIFPSQNMPDVVEEYKILLVRDFLKKQESYIQTQDKIMQLIEADELEELAEEKYIVNKSLYIEEETRDLEIISILYNKTNKEEQYNKAKVILEDIGLDSEKFKSFQEEYNLKFADIEISTLDEFKYDKRSKKFSDNVFSFIKAGVANELIDYNHRFIMVYVKNINSAREKSYQEVKEMIIADLKNKAENRKFNNILISLTQDKIEVNKEILLTLRNRYKIN
jgi:peptidyl-prolyl cis-trans isomerase C